MSDKKSVQIKGKHNLDLLLKRERKRVDNIIPELNEKYDTRYSQLQLINCIYLNFNCGDDQELVKKALMKKLSGYKSQDMRKKIFNNKMFITFDNMIQRLVECKLKCFYCNCNLKMLYSDYRDKEQWTLDRIDNSLGHNSNNLLVACLDCNLKRRDMDKDKFLFTQNLQIKKID